MTPDDLRRISAARSLIADGKAREQRERHRLTLREVADAVGSSPSSVHRWEQGTSIPRSVHALRWATAVGLDLEAA